MEGNAAKLVMLAREAGYYPDTDPPVFSQNGGLVEAGSPLTMTLPGSDCDACRIYYTTDGSDPRMPVTGTVSPTAVAYQEPLTLTAATQIKSRVLRSGEWSALHQAVFSVVKQDNRLRLTEIMYNPAGGDDYEFIELQNTGGGELDLIGFSMEDGVRFTFPFDTRPLQPGEFAVLVRNPQAFTERYPDVPFTGVYDGSLSNKGELLTLIDDNGEILIEVRYDDEGSWPISADGRGDSLNLINETGNPSEPENWRASTHLHGSPGAVEPAE
jgi:hypothetical protein